MQNPFFGGCYSTGDDKEFEADQVMYQVHAELFEETTRTVKDVPGGPVDVKGCLSPEAVIHLRGDDRRKADGVRDPLYGQLAVQREVGSPRRAARNWLPACEGKGGGRVAGHIEEVFRAQVGFEHLPVELVLQVQIADRPHVQGELAGNELAVADDEL